MLIVADALARRFTSHRDQSFVHLGQQHPGGLLFDVESRGSPEQKHSGPRSPEGLAFDRGGGTLERPPTGRRAGSGREHLSTQ